MRQQGNLSVNGSRRNPAIPCLEPATFPLAGMHCARPHLRQCVVVRNYQELLDENVEPMPSLVTPLSGLGPTPQFRHALEAERQRLFRHMDGVALKELRLAPPRMQQTMLVSRSTTLMPTIRLLPPDDDQSAQRERAPATHRGCHPQAIVQRYGPDLQPAQRPALSPAQSEITKTRTHDRDPTAANPRWLPLRPAF